MDSKNSFGNFGSNRLNEGAFFHAAFGNLCVRLPVWNWLFSFEVSSCHREKSRAWADNPVCKRPPELRDRFPERWHSCCKNRPCRYTLRRQQPILDCTFVRRFAEEPAQFFR